MKSVPTVRHLAVYSPDDGAVSCDPRSPKRAREDHLKCVPTYESAGMLRRRIARRRQLLSRYQQLDGAFRDHIACDGSGCRPNGIGSPESSEFPTHSQRTVALRWQSRRITDTARAIPAMCAAGLSLRSSIIRRAAAKLLSVGVSCIEETFLLMAALARCKSSVGRQGDGLLPPALDVWSDRPEWESRGYSYQLLDWRIGAAIETHLELLLTHQRRDGSWQSSSTVTALALQAHGEAGYRADRDVINDAVRYLRRMQMNSGCWPRCAADSVVPLESTCEIVKGLAAVGVSHDDPVITAAAEWLALRQQPDGSWTAESDADESSNVICTSLAVTALLSSGSKYSDQVSLSLDRLLDDHFVNRDRPYPWQRSYQMPLRSVCCWLEAICCWASSADNRNRTFRDAYQPKLRICRP